MRIKSVHVSQFKSLVDFQLNLAKFSCLIGLNGAGKSTVLQFFDFLSQQMRGDVKGWLDERGWEANELLTRPLTHQKTLREGTVQRKMTLARKKKVGFAVVVLDKNHEETLWHGLFEPKHLYCTKELVQTPDVFLNVESGRYSIETRRTPDKEPRPIVSGTIPFSYEGSILSQLREDTLPLSLLCLKQFMLQTESLDMLTPERLRQQERSTNGSLGHGGRNLSAFLYELGLSGRKQLATGLKKVYQQLDRVDSKSLPTGAKQLRIREVFEEGEEHRRMGAKKVVTKAMHMNDGMLRLIAILAELVSDHEFLLFDEIENGINPELVEFVTDALVQAKQQVLVTTHSPMILNYLDDQTAENGVNYLYKTRQGFTKSIPFFSIPSIKKKLTVMGPGEAFVDTDLPKLTSEIAAMEREGA